MCRFKSCHSHQYYVSGYSAVGSALVWGARGREFKSRYSDHNKASFQITVLVFLGKNPPAYSYGNPHLYMQCKADEKTLAVGLWSFCADPIFQPVVELGENYDKIEFINCDGKLCGNLVSLSEIAPYGFAAFVTKKL